jgi:hypothetical protein
VLDALVSDCSSSSSRSAGSVWTVSVGNCSFCSAVVFPYRNVCCHLPALVNCSLRTSRSCPTGAAGVAGGVPELLTMVTVASSAMLLTSSVVTVPGRVTSCSVDRRPNSQTWR